MPRISTDNYDTVAAWNGSQDLFIVEQPDGTKVATPAMVKQYVLDGVTETSEQYAESSTARNVTAKTVTLPGFELETGARISVRFTNTGTSNPASGNLTLNVNGTGAKEIVDSHTNKTKLTYTSGGLFYNNIVNDFIYDGTYWVWMNRDNNTTYTSKAAASGGTATSLCTTGEKYTWNSKLSTSDIVNNLTSGGTNVPLSAEMGKTLNSNLANKADKKNAITDIMVNASGFIVGTDEIHAFFPFPNANLYTNISIIPSVCRGPSGILFNNPNQIDSYTIYNKSVLGFYVKLTPNSSILTNVQANRYKNVSVEINITSAN